MITAGDDFPLHQTAEPIAYAGTDRNFYDRYFFNGQGQASGKQIFFAAALGVYPQLNVMDASFSLSVDGVQHSLRASKEMGMERLHTEIGPLRISVDKPLQQITLTIADNEHGLHGQLTCHGLHHPIEEPRFTRRNGPRLMMDSTRMTQNVRWEGEIVLDGVSLSLDGQQFMGTRDRSWGIRTVGAPDAQPQVPVAPMQFYWLWTPCMLDDGGGFFWHSNDDAGGQTWNRHGQWLTAEGNTTHYPQSQFSTRYRKGSRRVEELRLELADDTHAVLTTENHSFYMQGIGYMHPQWGHGHHHGALAVVKEADELALCEDKLAKGEIHYLHVQAQCRLTLERKGQTQMTGKGVIEQLLVGPHAPSGFKDLLDGAA